MSNPGTGVSFGGVSFQTANIVTADIGHFDIPTKDNKLYTLAHANGSAIPFVSYSSKTITVIGKIFGTSVADLDSRIDTMKGNLTATGGNLDIDYNSGTRRYIATVNKAAFQRPGGLLYANFNIEFICTNPFGQDTASTTALTATGRTLGSYADTYTFLGTAPLQRPVITVTYTALSASGSQAVNISNNSTGQNINIQRTWATADVLVVDTTLGSTTPVMVNGIGVNFSGAFPVFPPGSGTIGYSDTFTSRTLNYTVAYTVLYM